MEPSMADDEVVAWAVREGFRLVEEPTMWRWRDRNNANVVNGRTRAEAIADMELWLRLYAKGPAEP